MLIWNLIGIRYIISWFYYFFALFFFRNKISNRHIQHAHHIFYTEQNYPSNILSLSKPFQNRLFDWTFSCIWYTHSCKSQQELNDFLNQSVLLCLKYADLDKKNAFSICNHDYPCWKSIYYLNSVDCKLSTYILIPRYWKQITT